MAIAMVPFLGVVKQKKLGHRVTYCFAKGEGMADGHSLHETMGLVRIVSTDPEGHASLEYQAKREQCHSGGGAVGALIGVHPGAGCRETLGTDSRRGAHGPWTW